MPIPTSPRASARVFPARWWSSRKTRRAAVNHSESAAYSARKAVKGAAYSADKAREGGSLFGRHGP